MEAPSPILNSELITRYRTVANVWSRSRAGTAARSTVGYSNGEALRLRTDEDGNSCVTASVSRDPSFPLTGFWQPSCDKEDVGIASSGNHAGSNSIDSNFADWWDVNSIVKAPLSVTANVV
jgi:hypothetical protein